MILHKCLSVAALLCMASAAFPVNGQDQKAEKSSDLIAAALETAGENRGHIQKALDSVSGEQKKAMRFLVENMPERDLKKLEADYLIENVKLAFQVRDELPWGKTIPEEIFLNDVIPYINIDETRENWRKEFYEMCLPMVKDCKTAAAAAQRLNEKLFAEIGVRYSTQRKKANQSPSESIEQGLASCTGLSILLVDACRSVGVPARLVGIPSWPNKRGNHTWVEIWDQQWHFTGACEASAKGLNHTWFQNDAALAIKDSRMNAIYAVSYKKTETRFPMVWSRRGDWVYAVNVTDRYTNKKETTTVTDTVRLMIRVYDSSGKTRIAVPVSIFIADKKKQKIGSGTSRDESFDTNDIFELEVPKNTIIEIVAGNKTKQHLKTVHTGNKKQKTVDVVMQ